MKHLAEKVSSEEEGGGREEEKERKKLKNLLVNVSNSNYGETLKIKISAQLSFRR